MTDISGKIETTIRDFLSNIQSGTIYTDSKHLVDELPTYRTCFHMKCVFIGKLSTGKSTIINAVVDKDCLPTGSTEVTVNFFTVEATDKDYEYFKITNRITGFSSSENKNIADLKNVKRLNYDVNTFPNTDSIIKIYLNKNNEILKNGMVLVDCPGYDRGYVDTIQYLCNDADIINVVIDIKEGITDITAKDIKDISKVFIRGPTTFIYNKCEDMSTRDKESAKLDVKKHFDINSRFKHTESEDEIFFLSGLNLHKGVANVEDKNEFNRFKTFLKKQIPIINISRKNGITQLGSKIKALSDKIERSVPKIDDIQLRDIEKTKQSQMDVTSKLSDLQITELFKMIDKTVDANKRWCYKDTADLKVVSICADVNKMISEFLEQSCLRSNEKIIVKDGEATKKANDIFYKTFFVASDIKINDYGFYHWGEKTSEVETNFKKYLHESVKEKEYKKTIKSHYKKQMAKFLDCALQERNECIEYRDTLRSLIDQLLSIT